ncbi:protein GREB1-like isoform X2 [Polyodon spathula]|uniref:protein GREB1-like isoform X2 n=1 Tax=Polyodon spathula TaxID=7913 RepID=UPI001B7F2814|nr:protein GREB1-like isoform X2 [Polyodon spathula]
MGNSYAGRLKTKSFEEILHNYIEASLRSSNIVPRPIFSQLYLEGEQQITSQEAGRLENKDDVEDDGSESSSPPIPYQMKPPPEGACTIDGFCQSGRDLRLSFISNEQMEVPLGFLLVGVKSPNLPDHLLVAVVDRRFLPDDNGRNALLGFSGDCVGCGEKGFRYFTEFSNHINLNVTTQPKKQKHLRCYLIRNAHGGLTQGPLICWRGTEMRGSQTSSSPNTSLPPWSLQGPGQLPAIVSAEAVLSGRQIIVTGVQLTGILADQALPPLVSGAPIAHYSGKDCHRPQLSLSSSSSSSQPTRPSVIGTLANSGPPKKRYKGWSPESPSATDAKNNPTPVNNGSKADSGSLSCLSQPTPAGPLLSPLVTSEEPVAVPGNLLKICRTQPVIFKGHGSLPYFCGNVNDVIISPLLHSCYQNSQALPRVYEQDEAPPIQPLSVERMILLTVYYLVQLAPDQVPLIEDLEQVFMYPRRESHLTEIRQYQQTDPQVSPQGSSQKQPVTPAQLPWLARLAASSSNNSVQVIVSTNTLAEGLSETFKCLVQGKLAQTNFVVILCTSASRGTESCVVVTGKHQARALAESMSTPIESLKEINYELATGKAEALRAFFSSICPDVDTLLEKFSREKNGSVSLSSNPELSEEMAKQEGQCSKFIAEWHQIHPVQLVVARKLLSHVCAIADSSTQNLDLGSFEKVEFLISVPPSEVTFQQIVLHLWSSGILLELGLEKYCMSKKGAEQYVVKLDSEAQGKIDAFIQKSRVNPYTLFILVHDHAHWDLSSEASSPSDSPAGLVDRLLNCREIKEAPNILTLQVTSFPYALQTQHTRISPYNEIHWPPTCSNDADLYHENTKHFGLSELIESTRSGHSLPVLRYDSSFQAMVMALRERFPKLHSVVIRTYVLIQHYAVAMMAVVGLSQMKKYTSVETLEIIQNLINAPEQCPSRHGSMVLLRIPSVQLAAVAYERLCQVREKLGLQQQFEIILGSPNTALSVGKHFLEMLKTWLKIQDAGWVPRTYLELEALPCILIFTGMNPQGESLPRSLKYCDLRLINSTYLTRTALEQELGLTAHLVKSHGPSEKVPASDLTESDPETLSSTDNEEEAIVMEAFSSESTTHAPAIDTSGKHLQSSGLSNPDKSAKDLDKIQLDSSLKVTINESSTSCDPQTRKTTRILFKLNCSASSTDNVVISQSVPQCPRAKSLNQPPIVFLPKAVYDVITSVDSSGLPKSTSFLPHHLVTWASSFRPLLSKIMTCTEQSLYYRQWTIPKHNHMDSKNIAEEKTDNFHPRSLLFSGPPQVGKTGAYLQFLGILSTEVDIYDEEEINSNVMEDSVQYHKTGAVWPDVTVFNVMPFDCTVHNPKYEGASPVYSRELTFRNTGSSRKQEDVYMRRRTTRMRLSKYAAYNTYHHCEQCHQYMGLTPRHQLCESALHAFSFSYSMLGEEIQLYFIIPKSKEHHFSFSQPGGQLESVKLPLTSDKNPDFIKSPIFTPTTGRHEYGHFNLYHAMEGVSHLNILVIKEYEMAAYKKYWPNHILLVLPSIFNGAGAVHFLIKELSYHNLELERNRQEELGIKPQDIWPFIIVGDDSCVMWNMVDVVPAGDSMSKSSFSERNVSLRHVLQHIEATPAITQYGLCGMRQWSSRQSTGQIREPFSHCHLHDFVLLNVDLTQNVQFNQNRFTCVDVDFNLRAHSAGLLICRFNNFSVMKKQIAIGGQRAFIIKSKYICAPDCKHTFLAAPAPLLLEKYLQHTSHRFFPMSLKNYAHPVLSVDCYLNLGSEIAVCYVSSHPHSINIISSGLHFGGLLLYICDSFVTASFLKKFQFLKGATLCVVCPDRNSLRQTVVRLELEEEWRFWLRDEFQTANPKEDKPLFFLTGERI